MLIAHIYGLKLTANYGFDVTVVTNIVEKGIADEEMYFVLENIEYQTPIAIECNKATYDALTTDATKLYTIHYRCAKKDSRIGYLIEIQ